MNRIFLMVALLCAGLAHAQSTYRWVDSNGRVHYSDHLPPEMAGKAQKLKMGAPVADKQLPYAVQKAMQDFPVTLYVSADCGNACKEAGDYLRSRRIPFSEKNVASKEDSEALGKLIGGSPVVPVLQVGSRTVKGFESSSWGGVLDAAGYPKEAR